MRNRAEWKTRCITSSSHYEYLVMLFGILYCPQSSKRSWSSLSISIPMFVKSFNGTFISVKLEKNEFHTKQTTCLGFQEFLPRGHHGSSQVKSIFTMDCAHFNQEATKIPWDCKFLSSVYQKLQFPRCPLTALLQNCFWHPETYYGHHSHSPWSTATFHRTGGCL